MFFIEIKKGDKVFDKLHKIKATVEILHTDKTATIKNIETGEFTRTSLSNLTKVE